MTEDITDSASEMWSFERTERWLLEVLQQQRLAVTSDADAYVYLDFAQAETGELPPGTRLREVYEDLVGKPFEAGAKGRYIVHGPLNCDSEGTLLGAQVRITDVGEKRLAQLKAS